MPFDRREMTGSERRDRSCAFQTGVYQGRCSLSVTKPLVIYHKVNTKKQTKFQEVKKTLYDMNIKKYFKRINSHSVEKMKYLIKAV